MPASTDRSKKINPIPIWLMIVITVLSIPLCGWCYLLHIRSTGIAEYEKTLAHYQSLGYPTDIEDLLTDFPDVNALHQEELWVAIQKIGAWNDEIKNIDFVTHGPVLLEHRQWEAIETHGEYHDDIESLGKAFNKGDCYNSAIAWKKADPDITHNDSHRSQSLMASKNTYNWILIQQLKGNNTPTQQETLRKTLGDPQHIGDVIGLMIHSNHKCQFENAALFRTWARHEKYMPTIETKGESHNYAAQSFIRDSMLSQPLLINTINDTNDSNEIVAYSTDGLGVWDFILVKYWGYYDLESNTKELYHYQLFLDGHRTTPFHPAVQYASPHFKPFSYQEALYTVSLYEAQSRMRFLSSLMLTHYRTHKALPADRSELIPILGGHARLLDADTNHIGLTYERLAAGRFRFGLDNTNPPQGMPGSRITSIHGPAITKPSTAPIRGKRKGKAIWPSAPHHLILSSNVTILKSMPLGQRRR